MRLLVCGASQDRLPQTVGVQRALARLFTTARAVFGSPLGKDSLHHRLEGSEQSARTVGDSVWWGSKVWAVQATAFESISMRTQNDMRLSRFTCSALLFATLAFTALSVASDRSATPLRAPTANATGAFTVEEAEHERLNAGKLRALQGMMPQPGLGRPDLSAIGLSDIGMPSLTAEQVRRWKIGDEISFATPEGQTLDLRVTRRAWTAADEAQVYLGRTDTANSIYGIVCQIGPRLAGYVLARSGAAYAITAADGGTYRLTRRPDYGQLECGVGRELNRHPEQGMYRSTDAPFIGGEPTAAAMEGGIAGAPASPCPPEVAPIDIPPGLVKDGGLIIDVLFVFSVDAEEYIREQGSTPYDQAVATIAQANLALYTSTDQGGAAFDGADLDNNLNTTCGYGSYPEPDTVANPPVVPPPAAQPPASCADNDSRAFHEARAGVTPAESDVCLPRLRLVGALVCDGFYGQEEPFVSTGYAIDLDRLQTRGDGYLDYVHDWRDALGADEVAFVGTNYGSDSAFVGLASVMNDANNVAQGLAGLSIPANPHPVADVTNPLVVAVGGILGPSDVSTLQAFSERPFCLLDATILGDLVYAHELGHNFGCQHNHDAPSPEPADALFPDSYGFGDDDWRTVMAYAAGENVRLPGFSNPNKRWADYGGEPDDEEEAGKAFDFDCTLLDGDGTDAEYIEESGVTLPDEAACTNTSDDAPNSPAAMVVASDSRIEENAEDCANNARSISQVKFDFARFRCSIVPVVDCNDNEIDDYVEAIDGQIVIEGGGTSGAADCNGDGIPDVCQVAVEDPGISSPLDCNQNEVPDSCDIANGDSQDVNNNGFPDECEDSTLAFFEGFETKMYGAQDGLLEIARISPSALAELRVDDPDFPEYFATIETQDQNDDTVTGGCIYTDNIPSIFQYGLGENGSFGQWGAILGQGFATAFGSRGYGQRLVFNGITGDFPSGNAATGASGVTIIRTYRPVKEARFFMNAFDFKTFFDLENLYPGTFPGLANHPYLEANMIVVEGLLTRDDLGNPIPPEQKFVQVYDMRAIQTPLYATGFANTTIEGGPVRIALPFGSDPDPDFKFDEIRIGGAFVVVDNISFDLGQEFAACPPDIAGGVPQAGLPTPDGRVSADDLLFVLALFGVDPATNPLAEIADLDNDGDVDSADLLEILASWGSCPGGSGG